MATIRRLSLMHSEFGRSDGNVCKDCSYFLRIDHHGKTYRKCKVYGVTPSEASDWLAGGTACGLFPDKPYGGDKDVISLVTREAQKEPQVQGQMNFFDVMEGDNE